MNTRPSLAIGYAVVIALGAFALGCGGNPTAEAVAGPGPSPDEPVLIALDCYNPMYQIDENGRVTRLNLIWRHLPSPVLAEIGKLTELQGLDLAHSTADDDGLAQLKDLQNLRNFGLAGTRVTDRGLAHLQKLEGLQWVWLPKERVSQRAMEKLQEARPDMHVYLQ